MAKPIIFGEYQFRTKNAAIEEIKRRINQYEYGDRLNLDDQLFFESLFTLHSEYQEKVGVGIDHIEVERDFHHNRCLFIHRLDRSKIGCSWVHCVQPASLKSVVANAFRRAVKERIIAFKTQQLSKVNVCPVLGIPLNHQNSHVSYVNPSFDQLLRDFLDQNGLTLESIKLTNPDPNDRDQRGILQDNDIKERWDVYHESNSTLELLSATANLRRTVC